MMEEKVENFAKESKWISKADKFMDKINRELELSMEQINDIKEEKR